MGINTRLMLISLKKRNLQDKLVHKISRILTKNSCQKLVTFSLDNEYVHLTGEVKDVQTKYELQNEIDSLIGVRGITNHIKIIKVIK